MSDGDPSEGSPSADPSEGSAEGSRVASDHGSSVEPEQQEEQQQEEEEESTNPFDMFKKKRKKKTKERPVAKTATSQVALTRKFAIDLDKETDFQVPI